MLMNPRQHHHCDSRDTGNHRNRLSRLGESIERLLDARGRARARARFWPIVLDFCDLFAGSAVVDYRPGLFALVRLVFGGRVSADVHRLGSSWTRTDFRVWHGTQRRILRTTEV